MRRAVETPAATDPARCQAGIDPSRAQATTNERRDDRGGHVMGVGTGYKVCRGKNDAKFGTTDD